VRRANFAARFACKLRTFPEQENLVPIDNSFSGLFSRAIERHFRMPSMPRLRCCKQQYVWGFERVDRQPARPGGPVSE